MFLLMLKTSENENVIFEVIVLFKWLGWKLWSLVQSLYKSVYRAGWQETHIFFGLLLSKLVMQKEFIDWIIKETNLPDILLLMMLLKEDVLKIQF